MSDSLYKGNPEPQSWERSRYNPQVVFVLKADSPRGASCDVCAFYDDTIVIVPGCAVHPCARGAWFTEAEAAAMRLESS